MALSSLSSSSSSLEEAAAASNDEGQLASLQDLEALVHQHSRLPLERVVTMVGYGSGVLAQQQPQQQPQPQQPQHGSVATGAPPTLPATTAKNANTNMVDLIVVVDDAYQFHRANGEVNPHHYHYHYHYSSLPWWRWPSSMEPQSQQRLLHRQAVNAVWWQRHTVWPPWLSQHHWFCNPGAYYCVVDRDVRHNDDDDNGGGAPVNAPSVPFRPFKYGVVQADDLLDDLTDWTHLYIAGRLQKPTVMLPLLQSNEAIAILAEHIQQAQANTNVPSALAAALLLLQQPQSSLEEEDRGKMVASSSTVYQRIAGVSYSGDFRMALGAEDPHKVSKLVHSAGQLDRWNALYQPAVEGLQREGILSAAEPSGSNNNHHDALWTWDTSPSALAHIASRLPLRFQHLASQPALLAAALASVVAPAARYQALKGLFTGGSLRTTWNYATRKLSKGGQMWSSR